MASDIITDAIIENATGPARASVDGQSMDQHSLRDQIEADRYLASKAAVAGKKRGLVFSKLKPPGTV